MKNKHPKKSAVKRKKSRKKVNFGRVKKPPKSKSKGKQRKLKITLPFEEAIKAAFSPIHKLKPATVKK